MNVDSTPINHISLCSGYGGLDLGLRRAIPRLRTVALVEIEAFACANLVAKMEAGHLDAAPVWTNLKTFDGAPFRGLVDIISGGYPCQPFSMAGRRKGRDDPRHLWPYVRRAVEAIRPLWCFFENVEGHLSMGYDDVYRDLREMGYSVEAGLFSAAEIGAPHRRNRLFILAHDNRARQPQPGGHLGEGGRRTQYGGESPRSSNGLADPSGAQRREETRKAHVADGTDRGWKAAGRPQPLCSGDGPPDIWPAPPGREQYGWEPPRVVANTNGKRNIDQPGYQQPPHGETQEGGAADGWCSQSCEHRGVDLADTERSGCAPNGAQQREPESIRSASLLADRHTGQAQPALGRDADGSAGGLDYAELCRASDSRTDELRALGNGVVPAQAERAFRTLYERLTEP